MHIGVTDSVHIPEMQQFKAYQCLFYIMQVYDIKPAGDITVT